MNENRSGAHFDETTAAIVIDRITVRDKDVAREAQRWTSGERGPVVDDPVVLARADLSEFVTEAVKIGAHALSATGQAQEAQAIERMLKEVREQATESNERAAEATGDAVRYASDTVAKAADAAKKSIAEVDTACRREFHAAVADATARMTTELGRLFGGTNPELIARLQPVLERFGVDLEAKVKAETTELLGMATKQFDVSDPTSPMAKHAAALDEHRRGITQEIERSHTDLSKKVDDLTTALRLKEAKNSVAQVTTIKGVTYADRLHAVLQPIATGLGDEYIDTSKFAGSVSRSKKGDGLLNVNGGDTRVVIEMTDSARTGWTDYFDEAERNRKAVAALGLVRTAEQNAGETIRMLGARRMVLAFDPDNDDADLLRTVVMMLRACAMTATTRTGTHRIATAEDKIHEAVAQLAKIGEVKKTAGHIRNNADKIEKACTAITSSIDRLLSDALSALAAAAEPGNLAVTERGVA